MSKQTLWFEEIEIERKSGHEKLEHFCLLYLYVCGTKKTSAGWKSSFIKLFEVS